MQRKKVAMNITEMAEKTGDRNVMKTERCYLRE